MKRLLLVTTLGIFCFVCRAQKTGDVDFGVKAGVDIATFKGEGTNGADVNSRTSLNAGMFMRYFIATAVAFRPELFYGGHGAEEGPVTYRFSSLFLPLLITYYLQSFYLLAGPQLSFLLTAQSKSPGGTDNIKEFYRTLNFSLVAGLGFMLGKRLGIDGRYNLGLGDIHKTGNAAVQNSIFMISLMLLLGR
jgi:hypothetical protein